MRGMTLSSAGSSPHRTRRRWGRSRRSCSTGNRCDLGIATDGDADRLGVIDNEGQFIHPNKLLVLLSRGLGQKCYEVPVGFKWVSAKMTETDAIIGGGVLRRPCRARAYLRQGRHIRCVPAGGDVAVHREKLSELYREICELYGELALRRGSRSMTHERKAELQKYLFEDMACPDFGDGVDHISREDGCKVYFKDGSWVICRFSGTEPLLRMAAEAETKEKADGYIDTWKRFLSL